MLLTIAALVRPNNRRLSTITRPDDIVSGIEMMCEPIVTAEGNPKGSRVGSDLATEAVIVSLELDSLRIK